MPFAVSTIGLRGISSGLAYARNLQTAWVKGISQAIANKVHTYYRDKYRYAGKEGQPRLGGHIGLRPIQHISPG